MIIRHVLMTADTVGGVWTYALRLADALAARGVRVSLATMGRAPTDAQRHAAQKVPGLRLHESTFRLEWMDDPWADVAAAGDWLLDLEAQLRPDIIHLNAYAHAVLPWQAPKLVVAHSCVLSWWHAVRGSALPPQWFPYRDAVKRGLAAADWVVAPSQTMLDSLSEHYGPPLGAQVIYNGIDPGHYAPDNKEPLLLTVGRLWDEGKNVRVAVEAAQHLSWPLYIAGDTHHPDGGDIDLGHVRHLGVLDEKTLAQWYGRAAIYVSPARYEPFGLSVLEAALSGCALVLGDIPSLRELWHGAALFVPPDNSSALTTTLQRLCDDAPLRRRLAHAARMRARRYSLARCAEAYHRLYLQMADVPRRRIAP